MSMRQSTTIVCIAFAAAFGSTQSGASLAEARQESPAAQQAVQPQQPTMADMMKRHEQMMAEMKAADAKLDALVKDMNAATGDAKIAAVAAVINELVQQHRTMHSRMGQMDEMMMGGRGRMMRR